jgi:hypothetical protein
LAVQATYGNATEEFMPLVETYCTVLDDQDPERLFDEPQWSQNHSTIRSPHRDPDCQVDGPTMYANYLSAYEALPGADEYPLTEANLQHAE